MKKTHVLTIKDPLERGEGKKEGTHPRECLQVFM